VIAIVDYGLGNVKAFVNVYNELNTQVIVARTPEDLKRADKIILPGVGAFDYAMQRLDDSGMRGCLTELVLNQHVPLLGVCVGMQILACHSEEGRQPGLGWIDGEVRKLVLRTSDRGLPLPHMGWNDVKVTRCNPLFSNVDPQSIFYFLHSYYFDCNQDKHVLATTTYGAIFHSAISCRNIYGVQFHPEKSHQCGMQLLHNFAQPQA
jgi:glutamine amidotransferase